jgi:hypothetical protein
MTKPCIICGTELEIMQGTEFQPNDGIAVETQGNYGSTVFDGCFDGDVLLFIVCDECMIKAGEQERAFTTRARRPVYSTFDGHETVVGWEKLDRPIIPWKKDMPGWLQDDHAYFDPEEVGTNIPNVEWFEYLIPHIQAEVKGEPIKREIPEHYNAEVRKTLQPLVRYLQRQEESFDQEEQELLANLVMQLIVFIEKKTSSGVV